MGQHQIILTNRNQPPEYACFFVIFLIYQDALLLEKLTKIWKISQKALEKMFCVLLKCSEKQLYLMQLDVRQPRLSSDVTWWLLYADAMKAKRSSKLTSSPLSHWLFRFHPTLLSKGLTFECLKTHTPASVYLRRSRLSPFVTPGSPLSSLHGVDLNAVTQNLLNCLLNTLSNLSQLLNECCNCFVTH